MPSQNAAISGGDRNESWDESVNQWLGQNDCILLSDCDFKQTFSGFGLLGSEDFLLLPSFHCDSNSLGGVMLYLYWNSEWLRICFHDFPVHSFLNKSSVAYEKMPVMTYN